MRGVCSSIRAVLDVVYLACEFDRINFIAEIQVKGTSARVNRYYDDETVEGVAKVEDLGDGKLALIGDGSVAIVGRAVNHHLLQDLEALHSEQRKSTVYSFGLIDFMYLQEYSSFQQSLVLAITHKELVLISIFQDPAEIQCTFSRPALGAPLSLLVAFNATICPWSFIKAAPQASFEACESLFPMRLAVEEGGLGARAANMIVLAAILGGVVVSLVCTGLGLQVRNRANKTLKSLRARLQKLRAARTQS